MSDDFTISPEEQASLEAELRALGGEWEEEKPTDPYTPPIEIPLILQTWPIEPPTSIPSLAVLQWSRTELQEASPHHPEANPRLQMVNGRISDLEEKFRTGVLSPERYGQAIGAMLQKLQKRAGNTSEIANRWIVLLEREISTEPDYGRTDPSPEVPSGVPEEEEGGDVSMADLEAEVYEYMRRLIILEY